MKLNVPWHQYALIILLAEKMQEKGRRFGKTALQKLVYLLQTVFRVPVGYEYSLYLHGPFCSELMDDLDYVDYIDGVTVDTEEHGYNISPSQNARLIKDKARDFLCIYQPHVEQLLHEFGPLRVRNLELISTIIFVDRDAVANERGLTKSSFINEIMNIKPHFSRDEIEQAVEKLAGLGYIERRK